MTSSLPPSGPSSGPTFFDFSSFQLEIVSDHHKSHKKRPVESQLESLSMEDSSHSLQSDCRWSSSCPSVDKSPVMGAARLRWPERTPSFTEIDQEDEWSLSSGSEDAMAKSDPGISSRRGERQVSPVRTHSSRHNNALRASSGRAPQRPRRQPSLTGKLDTGDHAFQRQQTALVA
ncbi:expressed unknown protein [Seminavis robusta]|uniref:Uncharacterized protein n=1 Tax=Seminavis robusta TaxID=568900 RepID=A0A9N8DNV6_9STRA|nr:expressed unknown protein [Seminavis robusta]|eukprot:Sro243_g096870.1 n/a (175) ;mRNA; r:36873-37397